MKAKILKELPDDYPEEKVKRDVAISTEKILFDKRHLNDALLSLDYGLTKEEIEKKKDELKLLGDKAVGSMLVPIYNLHPFVPVVPSLIPDGAFLLLEDHSGLEIFRIKKK